MLREGEDRVCRPGSSSAVGSDCKPSQVLLPGAFNVPAEFLIIQDSMQGWLDIGRSRCSCHDSGGDERRQIIGEADDERRNAENPGVATDLLRQGSQRLSSAGTWLSDRDPSSVLAEVKSFARRKPGTFIIGAAILGIVAGRLTRALADCRERPHRDCRATPGGH